MRPAIDPEVLVKSAVPTLRYSEINESPQWCAEVVYRQERADAFHQITCPDQVVTAKFIVTLLVAPGNAQRGNDGAGVGFVFVRKQKIDVAIKQSRVAFCARNSESSGSPLPLTDKGLACLLKRNTQRLR